MNGTPSVKKVFGIGFGKTGSKSLDRFLALSGYKSIHWPKLVDGIDYERRVAPYIDDPAQILNELSPILAAYEAFSDVPFPGLYRELALRYPEARFILMTRNLESWWRSAVHQWGLAWGPHRLEPFVRIQYQPYLPGKAVATLADKALFIAAHKQHVEQVKADLAGHALLCVDLEDPDLAQKLSSFLDVPAIPFPHLVGPSGMGVLVGTARMLGRKIHGIAFPKTLSERV